MFTLSIPGNRKKLELTVLVPYKEIERRNEIIKQLAKDCPYVIGDTVRPVSDANYKKEGLYRVNGIVRTWWEFAGKQKYEDVKWENDNPMIISTVKLETGEFVDATVNYFKKVEIETSSL